MISAQKAIDAGKGGGLVWDKFCEAAHADKTRVGVHGRRRAWKDCESFKATGFE